MPKKTKVTQPTHERPSPFPLYREDPLSIDERNAFRAFYASPAFKKVLRNAYMKKPSSFIIHPPGVVPNAEVMRHQEAKRLAQIQGWEFFEAALFQQLDPPISKSFKVPEESYTVSEQSEKS